MALKELPENSVDAIITDPPYGLSFMGKKWDYDVPSTEIWSECLRVLKPGGYLLAFAGTRTQHRMAVRIEDAGFEIRDMIAWIYGSGFPKSLNIGKAVDKLQGNEREELPPKTFPDGSKDRKTANHKFYADEEEQQNTYTNTKGTSEWEGWGTALKPALEPITVARKPLSEKTVAENALKWGTGGINIDGSRVGTEEKLGRQASSTTMFGNGNMTKEDFIDNSNGQGRFPANLIHDGSEEVLGLFPSPHGAGNKRGSGEVKHGEHSSLFGIDGHESNGMRFGDSGSAARFFKTCQFTEEETAQRFAYIPKASKSERNKGCEGLEEKVRVRQGLAGEHKDTVSSNSHPTVKPIALMEYLVKLVSKEGHTVLDPFLGSGTTAIACKNLNRNCIGIERDAEYVKISEARISAVK